MICALPAPASSQVASSQRPYKGLFGGSAADPEIRHSLDTSLSVLGGYEDNAVGSTAGAPLSPLYQTGFYTGFSGTLAYSWQGKSVQVGASVGTDLRYYTDQGEFIGANQFG